jgi:hypothetical protein
MAAPIEIDEVLGSDRGDRDVWAKSIRREGGKNGKFVPKKADLELAITSMKLSDTMQGSSTIEIGIIDPEWELVDSGFFDANENGYLDPFDVNYPEHSRFWWRLKQVEIDRDGGGAMITLTWMERAAADLMALHGPLKMKRGKTTRAEFLWHLCSHVRKKLHRMAVHLRSKELHTHQQVEADTPEDAAHLRDSKRDKQKSIHPGERITFRNFDGHTYTLKPAEKHNAEIVLDEAGKHTSSERAILALLEACIVEAPFFRNPHGGTGSSAGILQLTSSHGSLASRRNIRHVVKLFLTKGFTGLGGAVHLAKKHPHWSTGQIAQGVQGSGHPTRYDAVHKGAKLVLEAHGGAAGGPTDRTVYYRKAYLFRVGSTQDPFETYWDAMNRLADEVNWAMFVDGQNVYFDSEMTLIRQGLSGIVDRTDLAVIDFDSIWDARHIATEATLDLICDPFEFRAGEVLKLRDFGMASSGSTAKLPGRWLISEIERDLLGSLSSQMTLRQPKKEKFEPRAEIASRTLQGDKIPTPGSQAARGDGQHGRADDLYDEAKRISHAHGPYVYGGGHGTALSRLGSGHGMDCSSSTSLALFRAGLFHHSTAWASWQFAHWGRPGRGRFFTVWWNRDHVWIQFHSLGRFKRFDTSAHGSGGSGPRVRFGTRSTSGFNARHYPGL